MSNIRPESDLRNYNDVLDACREDSPVYLTKKGRGKYVLMDIEDYEKMKATMKLMAHIEESEKSAREEDWFSFEEKNYVFYRPEKGKVKIIRIIRNGKTKYPIKIIWILKADFKLWNQFFKNICKMIDMYCFIC